MDDLVIKPSDKGGNVVLWPRALYEKEAMRQLRDPQCYRRLSYNPLTEFQSSLKKILDRGVEDGILSTKEAESLYIDDPTISTIYFLPKIHKNSLAPPGRPIVSGNGNICEVICKFVDHYLQPLVETLPSFLRDTKDILRRMEDVHLDKDMLLITADVEQLYTSIRHKDGLLAALEQKRRFLSRGYHPRDVNRGYYAAKNTERQTLLKNPGREKPHDDIIRFITTFNSHSEEQLKMKMTCPNLLPSPDISNNSITVIPHY
ncbi:uncharacterized protein ACNLHF_012329 isoform 1-T1 [Anomaloglossus baeobatrachus]